ncbi:MAG: hypothetical protein K0S30_91 [Clostridia bacterium]|nr:hypothetical protein [Clostridia bacterium]
MSHEHIKGSVLPILFFVIIISLVYMGVQSTLKETRREQTVFLQKAIKRAAVQCYAIEGMYPPDIKYLEENYGILINHQQYSIHYEVFASNMMPDIYIIEKTGGE